MNSIDAKTLNKFFSNFLQKNNTKELIKIWLKQGNQTKLKNLLKNKNLKDPNAPKRGKSGYLFFCSEYRNSVKEDIGDNSKATDITRELGVRWNKLKSNKSRSKELRKFQNLAEKDKERYIKEKENYSIPEEYIKKKEKRGPKRSKSGYLFFCAEYRNSVKEDLGDNSKATDITRELGVRWNKIKNTNKVSKFIKLAEKDKERYIKEKETFLKKEEEEDEEEILEDEESDTVVMVKKAKRKLTGYQVFCSKNRVEYKQKFPDIKPIDITKKLSCKWKSLSKKEQDKYKI